MLLQAPEWFALVIFQSRGDDGAFTIGMALI
jgi:hypothetical protein